ncbi:class I SAM-dependent methyltransferase [Nostoc piscinale]|uniref:class I SAM-dependent methyltransferase n=1 Tax=Nostoc piscinale TaxID=224012 RepID=UPI0039A50630
MLSNFPNLLRKKEVIVIKTVEYSTLKPYLASNINADLDAQSILTYPISQKTLAIEANSYYFGHPEWAKNYFEACHRNDIFKSRWQAATGSWDDKIVVDIGCGPGNLFATLGGKPKLLIGVDVSYGGLEMAQSLGYTPVLADAHNLPFVSGFADIVAVNATLHHCDQMDVVLAEAARLVRPGGILITDHDPHRSAWDFQGLGMWLWQFRLGLYRLIKRGGHASAAEQSWGLATEVHHRPGDGVTAEMFHRTLEPLGFTVKTYPHNHHLGAETFEGNYGQSEWKYRFAQFLSGINPDSPQAALSLMCVATRRAD